MPQFPCKLEYSGRLGDPIADQGGLRTAVGFAQQRGGQVVLGPGPCERSHVARLQSERLAIDPTGLGVAPELGEGSAKVVERPAALLAIWWPSSAAQYAAMASSVCPSAINALPRLSCKCDQCAGASTEAAAISRSFLTAVSMRAVSLSRSPGIHRTIAEPSRLRPLRRRDPDQAARSPLAQIICAERFESPSLISSWDY